MRQPGQPLGEHLLELGIGSPLPNLDHAALQLWLEVLGLPDAGRAAAPALPRARRSHAGREHYVEGMAAITEVGDGLARAQVLVSHFCDAL